MWKIICCCIGQEMGARARDWIQPRLKAKHSWLMADGDDSDGFDDDDDNCDDVSGVWRLSVPAGVGLEPWHRPGAPRGDNDHQPQNCLRGQINVSQCIYILQHTINANATF